MAKDIEIQIGAQDTATEILKRVEMETQSLGETMREVAESTSKSTKLIELGIKGIGAAGAVWAGLKAGAAVARTAFEAMASSVEAYNIQAEAARGMTQAQLDFASALQKATNVGDEATLALIRQAEAMGATKETSQEFATIAVGLAEKFGIGQEEALKKVMEAAAGNVDTMIELVPQLENVGTASEKMAMISQAAAEGMDALKARTGTTQGIMERAAGAFGDLKEKIGEIIAPIYEVVYSGFAVFAETLQGALGPALSAVSGQFGTVKSAIATFSEIAKFAANVVGVAVEAMMSVFGALFSTISSVFSFGGNSAFGFADIMKEVAKGIIAAITFVEVGLTNLGTVFEMIAFTSALQLERMRADIMHVLTEVIPAYASWFGENFLNIIQDYFSAVTTVFINFGQKVAGFWKTIFDFIASGMEGGISGLAANLGEVMGGSLLEGFEAKTQALPEIAERSMTVMEKVLGDRITELGGDLSSQFQEKFQARIKGLDAEVNSKVELETPDLEKTARKLLGENADKILGRQDEQSKSGSGGGGELKAMESRLLTRATTEDPLRLRQTAATESSAKNLEKLVKMQEAKDSGMQDPPLQVELVT